MQKIVQWFFSTGTALEKLTVKAAEEQQKYANKQVYKALAAGATVGGAAGFLLKAWAF
jgi:ElaB/YqjD/DUF883 family membrane-anchored ribosome-binding protein